MDKIQIPNCAYVLPVKVLVVVLVRTMERGENDFDLLPKKGETVLASWDGSN